MKWSERRDLNPQGFPAVFETAVSADFTTLGLVNGSWDLNPENTDQPSARKEHNV